MPIQGGGVAMERRGEFPVDSANGMDEAAVQILVKNMRAARVGHGDTCSCATCWSARRHKQNREAV